MIGRHGPRFAALWVYLFGLFAVAIAQRWLFPPADHTVAFNVTLFAVLGIAAIAIITVLERITRR